MFTFSKNFQPNLLVYFERVDKNSTICPNKGKIISVFHGQNIHLLDGHISPIKNWTFFVESGR